ncbi:MAG TPA: peptide deformylase [Candidatus Paceibacterota bacterium]
MVTIVTKENPVLRQIAKPVTPDMLGTAALKKVLKDMKTALAAQDDGVAIAAPQIDVSLRIFVVSGRVFEMLYPEKEGEEPKKYPDMAFINPEIVKLSKEREEMEEGCLSVRYLYGKISRAKKAKVRAMNEKGEIFEVGGSGLLAQIFQHETDHLDGKLFIDNATDIHDVPPQADKE